MNPLRTIGVRTHWTVVCVLIGAHSAHAISLGESDDFQDGATAGWAGSSTVNIADAGPAGAGDHALQVTGASRFVVHNSSQWTGDYVAAGVTRIRMDVMHQNAFDLDLRLGVASGSWNMGGVGDTYVSSSIANVANDGQWHTIGFDVSSAGLMPSSLNNSAVPDAESALVSVTHLRLLHNHVTDPNDGAYADFRGSSLESGVMFIDNIHATAVPEPSTLLLAAGAAALAARRRGR